MLGLYNSVNKYLPYTMFDLSNRHVHKVKYTATAPCSTRLPEDVTLLGVANYSRRMFCNPLFGLLSTVVWTTAMRY